MFIEVNINVASGIGEKQFRPVYINLDLVKQISQGQEGKAKITFADGSTASTVETYDKLKAEIDGTLERYYKAPTPKEA